MTDQEKARMLSESGDLAITNGRAPVVVPYADFLARCERRRAMAAELKRQDGAGKVDAEPVAPIGPLPSDDTDRHDGAGPVKNADRAT